MSPIYYVRCGRPVKRYEVMTHAGKPIRVRVDTIAGRWQTIWTHLCARRSPHVRAIIDRALTLKPRQP